MIRSEPLTATEMSFLDMERANLPMHVAGVVIVEAKPALTMAELKHAVTTRLRRLPKLHQKAHLERGEGGPAWVAAGRLDLRAHLFEHRLRSPGNDSQLHELCARIHERGLDRRRPLWEIHMISGLAQGRQAFLVKTHHAITDGLAGVKLADALLDRNPWALQRRAPQPHFFQDGAPNVIGVLQDLVGLAFIVASGPIAVEGPFNGAVGRPRSFAAATLRLDAIIRLKRELGGTVDDVLVAIVASGLNRYLEDVHYPGIPHSLRAMLPVSTVAAGSKRLGTHVSAVFIDLPMGIRDLAALVNRISAEKAILRTVHAAAGGAALVEVVGHLPDPIRSALLRAVSRVAFANLVVSDIPGPDQARFLLGRRVLGCYPMMPLGGNVGLSIALMSVGGVIGVGVTADPALVPDVRRLAAAIGRAAAAQA